MGVHGEVGPQPADLLHQGPRAALAAEDQQLAGQHGGRVAVAGEHAEVAGDELHHVHPVPREVGGEGPRVGRGLPVRQVEGAAGEPRAVEAGEAQVGRDRGDDREGPAGDLRHPAGQPGDAVGQAAVPHRDALGRPGRAGGEDDVRQVVRADRHGRPMVGAVVGYGDRCDDVGEAADPVRALARRHHHAGAGGAEHVVDAGGGVGGVHRQVRAARLEDAEHGRGEVASGIEEDADRLVGDDSGRDQPVRQPVGAAVQFAVGEGAVGTGDGRPAGVLVHPPFDQRVHEGGGRTGGRARERGTRRRLQGYAVHRPPGLGGHRVQQREVPAHQVRRGRRVEQVAPVFQYAAEPGVRAAVRQLHAQVELRRAGRHPAPLGPHPGQHRLRHLVVEVEQHLEDRGGRQGPFRAEPFHYAFERHPGVGEGVQHTGPHPGGQVPSGRLAGEVGTDHDRVEEAADDRLARLGVPSRVRDAHGDVVGSGEPPEQGLPGGQQHHERGGARPGGERAHPGRRRVRHHGRDGRARPGRLQGPGPVGGQVEHGGQAGQVSGPPVEPGGVLGLLAHHVRVLRRRGRRAAGTAPGGVEGAQVGEEEAQRPAVDGDVVHRQGEGPGVRRTEQHGPQGRFHGQPERTPGLLRERRLQLLRLHGADGHRDVGGRAGAQHGLGSVRVHDAAQHPVPLRQVADGAEQGVLVQPSVEPQHRGHVVRGAVRLQLRQEPQSALRGRERDGAWRGGGRGPRGARGHGLAAGRETCCRLCARAVAGVAHLALLRGCRLRAVRGSGTITVAGIILKGPRVHALRN
ncbi:hypothetical protein ACE1SV_70440 [Streptomyces sp. E-15]